MQKIRIKIDGKEHLVMVEEPEPGRLVVHAGGEVFEVRSEQGIAEQVEEKLKGKLSSAGKGLVEAPLPGIIFDIYVKPGEKVAKGKKLMSLMAMKMENEVVAPVSGVVKEIKVQRHMTVAKGDILCVIG